MKAYATHIPQRQNIPKSELAKTKWFKAKILEAIQCREFSLPFGKAFTLQFDAPIAQNIQIQIFNILGEKVYTQSLTAEANQNELVIPSADWASGSYFLQLQSEDRVLEVRRLLKW